jgi:hypothetical protein
MTCLENSGPIEHLFSAPPPLDKVRLHEVVLHRYGPRLSIRFDLGAFPVSPPKKWVDKGYNTVQITLTFGDIQSLSISLWSSENIVDIDIGPAHNAVSLRIMGSGTMILGEFGFAEVEKVTAYCMDPSALP